MPTINRKSNTIKLTPYKHDDQSQKYYNNKYWINLRQSYFATHPLCEECLKNDIITPSSAVHHLRPFLTGKSDEERWQLALDPNNLMSVCNKCHREIHRKLSKN